MTMYGNDDTGEVIEIVGFDRDTRQYVALQHILPNSDGKPGVGVIHTSSYHGGMSQWWAEYRAKSTGKFYKLVRHTFSGAPIEQEMPAVEQTAPLPYTQHSDASVPTVPAGTEVPR